MDFIFFVHALAVTFAVLSGLLVVLRLGGWYLYNHTVDGSVDKARDIIMHGGTATFPIWYPSMVFIVCIIAIFSMNG